MLLVAGVGCNDEKKQAERAAVERVSFAVGELREADEAAKGPRLAALRAVDCGATPACELQTLCANAYAAHISGVSKTHAVARSLEQDAGVETAESAGKLLEVAERDVKKAKELTGKCADLEGVLRRRYGV